MCHFIRNPLWLHLLPISDPREGMEVVVGAAHLHNLYLFIKAVLRFNRKLSEGAGRLYISTMPTSTRWLLVYKKPNTTRDVCRRSKWRPAWTCCSVQCSFVLWCYTLNSGFSDKLQAPLRTEAIHLSEDSKKILSSQAIKKKHCASTVGLHQEPDQRPDEDFESICVGLFCHSSHLCHLHPPQALYRQQDFLIKYNFFCFRNVHRTIRLKCCRWNTFNQF